MMDPDEVFQDRQANLHAALQSVKKEMRGLPQSRAEEVLRAALRRHDAFVSPDAVRVLARHMSDPWWGLRHPVKARRLIRGAGDEPDDSARLQAESEDLSRRLEGAAFSMVERMKVDSHRTFDGVVYTVSIAPWSAEVAEKIRAAALPIPVTVRPLSSGD